MSLLNIKIFKKYKNLVMEGSWVMGGQIFSLIGAIILVRILTEYLNPDLYGELSLGLTIAGLINQIAIGGIGNSICRHFTIAEDEQDINNYLRACVYIMIHTSIIIFIIGFIVACIINLIEYNFLNVFIASVIFAITTGCNTALNAIYNGNRKRNIVAIHNIADIWLKFTVTISIIILTTPSSTNIIYGYTIVSIIIAISQIYIIKKTYKNYKNNIGYNSNWVSRLWKFAIPFSTWGLFTWSQQASDRWSLQMFATTREVGLYAVVLQLGYTPINQITNFAMSFLGPILFNKRDKEINNLKNLSPNSISWSITYLCLLITILLFIFCLFFHELIFNLLVAAEYHSASSLLPWAILAGGFFSAGQILSLKLISDMNPSAMRKVKILTAIIGVILNLYLTKYLGLKGLIIASVLFSAIYFLWMAKITRIKQ